jgi:hypothetical protein
MHGQQNIKCLFYSLSFIIINDKPYIQPENRTTNTYQIEAVLSNFNKLYRHLASNANSALHDIYNILKSSGHYRYHDV